MPSPVMSWTAWPSLCSGQTVTPSASLQVDAVAALCQPHLSSLHSARAPFADILYRRYRPAIAKVRYRKSPLSQRSRVRVRVRVRVSLPLTPTI